jgi:glyoxylase-like metal-dependent hydrolase (beta-lactamase superfamily II)
MNAWRWAVLSDGWTEAHEGAAIRGGSWFRKVRFHATAVLLEHERHGRVLFDTGYSTRFFAETARWPYRVYRWLTPVTLTEPGGIAQALRNRGIPPESVPHVIVSHWHADHIGGLRDFPQATLHTSKAAWDSIQGARGFAALRKACLPALVPDDAASRLNWIGEGSDLFGDAHESHATPHHQAHPRLGTLPGLVVSLASDASRRTRSPHRPLPLSGNGKENRVNRKVQIHSSVAHHA